MRALSKRRGRGPFSDIARVLGERLARRRRALGLDAAGLESAIGLRAGALAAVEQGRGELSAAEIHDLAAALDVSIDYFFERALSEKEARAARRTGIDDAETESFVAAYWAIRDAKARRSILALIRAAAGEDSPPK